MQICQIGPTAKQVGRDLNWNELCSEIDVNNNNNNNSNNNNNNNNITSF